MDTFNKRLQHLATQKKIDQIDIARGLGQDSSSINRWWKGNVIPGPKNLRKLSDFFGCNIDWLADGTGEMFPEQTTDKIGLKESSSRIAELNKIPVLGKVPAGIADTLEANVAEYISVPNAPPDCYALKVSGESMEPGLKHGDYVLFVIDREVKSGDVVVVNDEFGDSMIKRYKEKGDEQRLVSDNPAYPTYIPNSRYRIMGVVVGGWRELKL